MSAPITPLDDGANISGLNTTVTDLQTYVNDLPVTAVRRGCFNRYHARNVISNDTTTSPKVNTTLGDLNFAGGTYTYSGTWTAMGWSSTSSNGGSVNAGDQNVGNWTIIGHPTSAPTSAGTTQILYNGLVGMSNSSSGQGAAAILLQGNFEVRSFVVSTTADPHLHLAYQFWDGTTWYTIESTNRVWALEYFQGQPNLGTVNLDMNCSELLTPEIVLDKSGGFNVEGVRAMLALSDGGGAAPANGTSVTLGNWVFSAAGLYAQDAT